MIVIKSGVRRWSDKGQRVRMLGMVLWMATVIVLAKGVTPWLRESANVELWDLALISYCGTVMLRLLFSSLISPCPRTSRYGAGQR